MTPLGLYENIEQAIQPLVTSQVDREIKIQTSNKYSVNKSTASTDLRDCWTDHK